MSASPLTPENEARLERLIARRRLALDSDPLLAALDLVAMARFARLADDDRVSTEEFLRALEQHVAVLEARALYPSRN